MFDKFCDYMYYLLTSPFKRVKKLINQWYILFRVLGRRFDDAMESLYSAGEQTMLATCKPEMLPVHAEDRKISRYPGEEDENFRVRMANYPQILRFGGSNKGVLIAIKSLGYNNPKIIPANKMNQYLHKEDAKNRWAEFYVVIKMSINELHPVSLEVLKREVRKAKYITAKDNYYFGYTTSIRNIQDSKITMNFRLKLSYWMCILLDGSIKLDGKTKLDSKRTNNRVCLRYNFKIQHKQEMTLKVGGAET